MLTETYQDLESPKQYTEDELVTIGLNMAQSKDRFIRLLGIQLHYANHEKTAKLQSAFPEEFKLYLKKG
jgi:hypothetical protein